MNLKSLPVDRGDFASFVEQLDRTVVRLAGLPLRAVAAVNGHAVAAGRVLAAACDVRVAAEGDYRIGFSEVDVGVPFPAGPLEIVRAVLPERWWGDWILGARLLSPLEALEAGLVHAVVPGERLLEEAMARAAVLAEKPADAFRLTKAALRAPLLARVEAAAGAAREEFVRCWFFRRGAAPPGGDAVPVGLT